MLTTIEKGVVTESTTKRFKELEVKQADLWEKIVLEQSKEKLNISKNEIVHYLNKAQLSTIEKTTKILNKQIILYDDKIKIYCNYTNNKNGPEGNTPQGQFLYTDKTVFKNSVFSKSNGKDRNVLIKVFFLHFCVCLSQRNAKMWSRLFTKLQTNIHSIFNLEKMWVLKLTDACRHKKATPVAFFVYPARAEPPDNAAPRHIRAARDCAPGIPYRQSL